MGAIRYEIRAGAVPCGFPRCKYTVPARETGTGATYKRGPGVRIFARCNNHGGRILAGQLGDTDAWKGA